MLSVFPNKRFNTVAVLISVALVIFLVAGWVFWFWQKEELKRMPVISASPQLYDIHDFTTFLGIFLVRDIFRDSKSMLLEYSLDTSVYGKKVTAIIDCPISDSKIIYTEGPLDSQKEVVAAKPLYEYPLIPDATTLRGYCRDFSCTQIIRGCALVYPMVYYGKF